MKQSPKYDTKQTKTFRNDKKIFPKKAQSSFKEIQVITKDFLKELTNTKYKDPVISVYLTKSVSTAFNVLRIDEVKKRNKFISQLPHTQAQSLKNDLDEITNTLENSTDVKNTHTLVLFKSGNELQIIVKLPLKLATDMLVIDSNPYTSPLTGLLQEQKKVMVVNLDKNETKFYMYENGFIEEIHKISHLILDENVDKSRPEKAQQHRLEQLNHHYKECGDFIYKHAMAHNFDCAVVVGHEEISTKKFINTLHSEVQNKLIDSTTISPLDFTKDTLPQLITQVLENHELMQEESDAAELAQAKGQHSIIEGIEQVLSAHNRGLLRELYIQGQYREDGYACPERHFIVLENGIPCPICGKELLQVKDCIDELIENAQAQNIKLHLFLKKAEIMDTYQKIAAVTYPPTS